MYCLHFALNTHRLVIENTMMFLKEVRIQNWIFLLGQSWPKAIQNKCCAFSNERSRMSKLAALGSHPARTVAFPKIQILRFFPVCIPMAIICWNYVRAILWAWFLSFKTWLDLTSLSYPQLPSLIYIICLVPVCIQD